MKNKQSPRQQLDAAHVVMNGEIIERLPNIRYPGDKPKATAPGSEGRGRPVFFRGAKVKQ